MLGLENFSNVILTSSLRDTVANPNMPENEFNKFFEHSLLVAKLCREISKDVIALSGQQYPGTAYLAGLFHDCGIPVLALRFPDYFNVVPGLYDQEKKLEWLEEERFETNHSVVGCLLVNMLSLVMLAEKIVAEQENKRNDGIPNIYTSMVSDACFEQIVTQLDLTGEQLVEFEELFDEISEVEL
jgi:HD-like signal output (HDOD) protein